MSGLIHYGTVEGEPNSRNQTLSRGGGRGNFILPYVQLTTSRITIHTRLAPNLLKVITDKLMRTMDSNLHMALLSSLLTTYFEELKIPLITRV